MRKFIVGLSVTSVFGLATFTSCNKAGDGSPRNVEDSEKIVELKLKAVPAEGKTVWFLTMTQGTIETSDKIEAYNDSILKVMPPEGEDKFTLVAYVPDDKAWTPAAGLMSGNYATIEVDKTVKDIEGTSASKVGYYVTSWGHIDASLKEGSETEYVPVTDLSEAGTIASAVSVSLNDLNTDYDINDIVHISATASDKDGGYIKSVSFDVNGQTFIQTQEPYYVDFNTKGKTPGKYVVKVIAINGNEYGNADIEEFILNRPEDGKAPTVTITSPAQASKVTIGQKIAINVSATDPDGKIANLTVSVDGVMIGTSVDDKGSYSFDWNVYGQPKTTSVITATATDDTGNVRTVEVNVKLASAPEAAK